MVFFLPDDRGARTGSSKLLLDGHQPESEYGARHSQARPELDAESVQGAHDSYSAQADRVVGVMENEGRQKMQTGFSNCGLQTEIEFP